MDHHLLAVLAEAVWRGLVITTDGDRITLSNPARDPALRPLTLALTQDKAATLAALAAYPTLDPRPDLAHGSRQALAEDARLWTYVLALAAHLEAETVDHPVAPACQALVGTLRGLRAEGYRLTLADEVSARVERSA